MIFAASGLLVLMTLSLASLIGVNALRRRRMHALAGIADKAQLRFVNEDVRALPRGLLQISPFCEGHDFRLEHSAAGQRVGKRLRMIDLCFERGTSVTSRREYYALLGIYEDIEGLAALQCDSEGAQQLTGNADRVAMLQELSKRFSGFPECSGSGAILCDGWIWIYATHRRREIPAWFDVHAPENLIAAIPGAPDDPYL